METKSVLITGAAKRIGRAMALHMANCGWNVAVHYQSSEEEVLEVVNAIKETGVMAIAVKADLSDEKLAREVVKYATDGVGKITCLINNASIFRNDNLESLNKKTWESHIATNLYAPLVLSQELVKQLGSEKGNIINMLDYCVWDLPDKFLSYSLSKYGLWGATQSLAKQLAPAVRVNGIGLGHSLPNEKETKESFEKARHATPLQTGADVNEICRAIDFILNSPSFTGQMLALDGGKHLVGAEYY